jgi:hypothetical protein
MPTVEEVLRSLVVNEGVEIKDLIASAQILQLAPVAFNDVYARYAERAAGTATIDPTWDALAAFLAWEPGEQYNAKFFRPYIAGMLDRAVREQNPKLLLTSLLIAAKLVK